MKLYLMGTNTELKKGDIVTDFRGNDHVLLDMEEPRHSSSSGHVHVRPINSKSGSTRYYAGVVGAEWRDE